MPLAMVTGPAATPTYTWITSGNLNEPLLLTNAAGAVTASTTRDPWGNPILLAGTEPLDLGYPGQWRDPATGLFQNWHRDYDPTLGRYTEADPLGLGGGSNVFAYVGGDPVNMVDPMGLDFINLLDTSAAKEQRISSGMEGEYNRISPAVRDRVLVVMAHGNPQSICTGGNANRCMKAEEFVKELRSRGIDPSGKPIVLWACDTGSDRSIFAQSLANQTRVMVWAPSAWTRWTSKRFVRTYDPNVPWWNPFPPEEGFKPFVPNKLP
jgi:RHS repeat-associated protein